MKVSLVFPVLNQFRLCVEAIESAVAQHELEVIIVPQYEHQRPLSAAWNYGIDKAISREADYILVANDDVVFSPWTIDALIETFEHSSDEVVMVTGVNNRGSCPDPKMMKYWPEPENVTTAEHPDFALFLVERGFIEKVGRFDENYIPAYF